jgi:choice-of-anchor C domain-containing protein
VPALRRVRLAITLGLLALASTAHAQNLVVNPSFEATGPAGITTRFTCNCVPPGFVWTVGGAGVDLVQTYWAPQDGIQSLDLNQDTQGPATPPGSISQTIATTPGAVYRVSFWMAGNPDHTRAPDDGPAIKTMDVSFGPVTQSFAFDVTGKVHADPGWVPYQFDVVANSANSLLQFQSTMAGYAGPLVDNVSVTLLASTNSRSTAWSRIKSLYR